MIICKGFKKNGTFHSCNFIFEGKWGSDELVKHQKYHESLASDSSYFWLGFEIKRSFSKLSKRDGKP